MADIEPTTTFAVSEDELHKVTTSESLGLDFDHRITVTVGKSQQRTSTSAHDDSINASVTIRW